MDYDGINVDDPASGDDEADLAVLAALTESVSLGEVLINERTVFAALGSLEGEVFMAGLEVVASGSSSIERVVSWLKPGPEAGIDIADVETQAILNSLVGTAGITQPHVDGLVALASTDQAKYPGIQMTHLTKARGMV